MIAPAITPQSRIVPRNDLQRVQDTVGRTAVTADVYIIEGCRKDALGPGHSSTLNEVVQSHMAF